ncbi:hypothetical protein B0H14DRAFT_3070640 [Mycena olivaceomarginata]|nr:hypothetical protein B0H14DRAFT_3070640 [Mycena olivaceomarginata]
MQGQVMGFATQTPTGEPMPVASAIFVLGLFADVFGAILSFSTARWFEMLTEEEGDYLQRRWDVEIGDQDGTTCRPVSLSFVDAWICLSLIAGPYVVVVGLVCLILGLLVYTWMSQHIAVAVMAGILSAGCLLFAMAFVVRHNRMVILGHFSLKRRSG